MNVVPRSTRNTIQIVEQRINSEVYIKVLLKPMNNPLGVSPSNGKQETTRGKEKIL